MDNPEKLATQVRQDKGKSQNENKKTQLNARWTPLSTSKHKQTQITLIRHDPSYRQLETNRTSCVCGNHNTEPKAHRHIIGEHKKLKRWATRIIMTLYNRTNHVNVKYHKPPVWNCHSEDKHKTSIDILIPSTNKYINMCAIELVHTYCNCKWRKIYNGS